MRVVWVSYELNDIFSSFKYDENFSLVGKNIIRHPSFLEKKIAYFHNSLRKTKNCPLAPRPLQYTIRFEQLDLVFLSKKIRLARLARIGA